MVGALADQSAQQEGAVQDLAHYHGGTLPPEDIERVLGRPMGQDSTVGLDRYQTSLRILAKRYGVPNTPLAPAGSAPQIFYPDLSVHGTGVPAAPMVMQPAATMAADFLNPSTSVWPLYFIIATLIATLALTLRTRDVN